MVIRFLLFIFIFLAVGCSRDDTDQSVSATPSNIPNSFLRYVNTQASLSAGQYTVVVGSSVAGAAGEFSINVTFDDGSVQNLSGEWVNSAGRDANSPNNPRFEFVLPRAGGIAISQVTASSPTYLYLLDRAGSVIEEGLTEIDLPNSQINNEVYAQAYYRAVDPNNNRTTLDDWRTENGFSSTDPGSANGTVHAIFRDTKDLGYGRDMYARTNNGQPTFYVNNYLVSIIPGESSNYGPLNLTAAIDAVTKGTNTHQIGTNAIEVSANPNDPSQNILKFFTFDADGNRITQANLDGRGEQFMPGMCFSCHGGRLLPLDENGDFQLSAAFDSSMPSLSVMNPKLNQLEFETFEFSPVAGYTESEMESAIREMNQLVHDFYDDQPTSNNEGNWGSDFSLAIAQSRYNLDAQNDFQGNYIPDGVPTAWQDGVNGNPQGTAVLFDQVIEPNCLGCHALQGSREGAGGDIAFESYEIFMSHKDQIVDYVYQRGVMPLSLRNYESFWEDPNDRPALLASFLVGSFENDRITNGGLSQAEQRSLSVLQSFAANPREPGLPVARAGRDIRVQSPVQLLGTGSLFADSYEWSVTDSPVGAVFSFDDNTSSAPTFTADLNGDYTISLTVRNGSNTATDDVVVSINSSFENQNALTFSNQITALFQTPINNNGRVQTCIDCHTSSGSISEGVPLFYSNGDISYEEVMARVNLISPEDSRLLRKATGNHHAGGQILNGNSDEYNRLYNWIQSGALR